MNLMNLHDKKEDCCLNKCIRITSKENPDKLYLIMSIILENLTIVNNITWVNLSKRLSKELNLKITPCTLYGWRGGKYNQKERGIPIILLEYLNKRYSDKIREIIKISDTIKIRSGQETKLIKQISPELSYLAGTIAGDGSLPNSFSDKSKKKKEYRITFSQNNKKFNEKVCKIIYDLFKIKTKNKFNKKNNCWEITFKSKYVHRLINKILKIPNGKKSEKVRMPNIIKKSNKKNINNFIKGVFDTDGCIYIFNKKYLKISLRMKSKDMIEDIDKELKKQNFRTNKYNYYGLSFDRKKKVKFYGIDLFNKSAERFYKEIGFINPDKILKGRNYFNQNFSNSSRISLSL